jgi:hypothetical protein
MINNESQFSTFLNSSILNISQEKKLVSRKRKIMILGGPGVGKLLIYFINN